VILIIGYGNPLRGDDGFGWHAAGRIGIPASHDTEILARHQLTPELAEPLSRADLAIFIDASGEQTPERLICRRIEPNLEQAAAFTHQVDAGGLLSLARELYGAAPEAYVISAVAENFDCGETLSPQVESVLEPAVRLAEQLIDGFAKGVPKLS
jgi:hydrogenase maturation protease